MFIRWILKAGMSYSDIIQLICYILLFQVYFTVKLLVCMIDGRVLITYHQTINPQRQISQKMKKTRARKHN